MSLLRKSLAIALVAMMLLPSVVVAQGSCSPFRTWSTGDSLTAGDLNSSFSQLTGTNAEFSCLNDMSSNAAEMNTTADPNSSGSASLATTGAGEIQRLRHIPKHVFGWTQWWTHYEDINFAHRGVRNHLGMLTGFQPLWRGEGTLSSASTRFHVLGFSVEAPAAHHESVFLNLHVSGGTVFKVGLYGDVHVGGTLGVRAGTVEHPALFHIGASTTGLSFPASGHLAASSGGTEIYRMHANGLFAGVDARHDVGHDSGSRFRNLHLAGGLTTWGHVAGSIRPWSTSAGNTGEVRYYELAANGTNYVGVKAPDSIAANRIWTLPSADGTNGQALITDGGGNLSFSTITAGISGTGVSSMTVVRKTADETVNNSTTLQNDDELLYAMAANAIVYFRANLIVSSSSSGANTDFKLAFTVPAAATLAWSFTGGINFESSAATASAPAPRTTSGDPLNTFTDDNSTRLVTVEGIVVNGANAGNLQLQWAQVTAAVSDTKVLTNSYLMVWDD